MLGLQIRPEFEYVARLEFRVAFADPPYTLVLENPGGWVLPLYPHPWGPYAPDSRVVLAVSMDRPPVAFLTAITLNPLAVHED